MVALVDLDEGNLVEPLYELLSISEIIRPVIPHQDETVEILKSKVKEGEFPAILIPDGYSHAMLQGSSPELSLMINPEIGTGKTAQWAIQTAVNRMQSVVEWF